MKFYALAYQYQEDVYFDFAKQEDVMDLNSTCLLPTKEMADQYIVDELSTDYVLVEIELETLNKNGTWSWSRSRVERWDEDFD